jgi:hypothetical protein
VDVLIAIVLLAVLGVTGWLLWRNANMHWAKSQVAKIEELEKAGKYLQAYDLSIVIQKYLGQDETINRLMPTISDVISVTSDPGDVANGLRSLPASIEDRLVPLIKSGRAVFGIVLEGYLERRRPEGYVTPDPSTVEYKELIVNRVTDVRRGLDYLLTRNDIDSHRIAFFGPSAGAQIGLILAAVENRYAAVVLQGAGIVPDDRMAVPDANPINFAPHIGARKLMVHGRYDEDTPFKTRAEPLFKLLREPKRLVMFEGSHVPSIELFVTNINAFLDETLGPVRRE